MSRRFILSVLKKAQPGLLKKNDPVLFVKIQLIALFTSFFSTRGRRHESCDVDLPTDGSHVYCDNDELSTLRTYLSLSNAWL